MVLTGSSLLVILLAGQVAVGSGLVPATRAPARTVAPTVAAPPTPTTAAASTAPAGPGVNEPGGGTSGAGRPVRAAGPPPVEEGARPRVDEVRVDFGTGAVLDEAARAALEPVVAVLLVPGAAPVRVQGSAEPGPDEAAATALARERAAVVVAALVARGVPEQLLRPSATVDAERGRAVVIVTDLP